MSIIQPEYEYVDRAPGAIRYLEHGWPTGLCRWHSHEEYELHLIVATRGKAFVGDYIGEFRPGSLFLTGPNLPHNWVTDGVMHPDPVEVRDMLVQFSEESVELLTRAFPEFGELASMWEQAKSGIEFEGVDLAEAREHLERIRDATGAARIAAFIQFLVRVGRDAGRRPLSVVRLAEAKDRGMHARIAGVVDHIVGHYHQRLPMERAASMANMSVAAFARNFKKATGSRYVEFVNRVRIGQACSLLYATDRHVSVICHEVGFQNLANFNRHFLKMKHMPPTAYRELARRGLAASEGPAA